MYRVARRALAKLAAPTPAPVNTPPVTATDRPHPRSPIESWNTGDLIADNSLDAELASTNAR
jgi:hypothetical protein